MTAKGSYEIGKGKPPKATQFKPGNKAGLGKTSEQKLMKMANAQAATRIQARLLQALEGQMLEDDTKKTIVDNFIKAEVLKLVKDAQDRGLGTAKQSVDLSSTDGTMTPAREMSDAQLQAIIEANAKPR